MKTSLTSLEKKKNKKKTVHLLITDIEPICVEHIPQQLIIIIIIAWSICFMQEKAIMFTQIFYNKGFGCELGFCQAVLHWLDVNNQ